MGAQTFLFDDACPMCKGYTGFFQRMGWSKRTAFSTIDTDTLPNLDLDRGRHEIPLIDATTQEVRYGLDAMTYVLAKANPCLKPLLRSKALHQLLKPIYWLITYNRRIIVGGAQKTTGFDCAPDANVSWQLGYIFLAFALLFLIGLPSLVWWGSLFSAIVLGLFLTGNKMRFLGEVVTVAVLTSLLLLVLPTDIGQVLALVFIGWELNRRA